MTESYEAIAGGSVPMALRRYDDAYIAGGCKGHWPTDTDKDTTVGCYSTNYLVGMLAFIGFVTASAMASRSAQGNNAPFVQWCAFLSYWLLLAMGMFLAGAEHQAFETNNGAAKATQRIAYVFLTLNNAGLLLATSLPLSTGCCCLKGGGGFRKKMCCLVFSSYAAAAILVAASGYFQVAGVAIFVTAIGTIAAQTCFIFGYWKDENQSMAHALTVSLSSLVVIVGIGLQFMLSGPCGYSEDGYGKCWADCPLPVPSFNHNALYHVCHAAAICGYIVAMFMKTGNATAVLVGTEAENDENKDPEHGQSADNCVELGVLQPCGKKVPDADNQL